MIIGYPWDTRVTPLASKVLHFGNWSESMYRATPCQKERQGEFLEAHINHLPVKLDMRSLISVIALGSLCKLCSESVANFQLG